MGFITPFLSLLFAVKSHQQLAGQLFLMSQRVLTLTQTSDHTPRQVLVALSETTLVVCTSKRKGAPTSVLTERQKPGGGCKQRAKLTHFWTSLYNIGPLPSIHFCHFCPKYTVSGSVLSSEQLFHGDLLRLCSFLTALKMSLSPSLSYM